MIRNTNNSPSLFSSLSGMLNQSHPLYYRLADKIDWGKFETAFQPLYVRTTAVQASRSVLYAVCSSWSTFVICQTSLWWNKGAKTLIISISAECSSSLRLPRVPLQNLFISTSVSVKRESNLSFRKAFVWTTRMMKAAIMIRPSLILPFRKRISLTHGCEAAQEERE